MASRFLLLYASQTGQAEAIAKEEIFEQAESHGLSPAIHCLSQTDKKFDVDKEKVVVFVASTTGDGDPPDTAQKFWRRLKKKTLSRDHLKHLKYSVLGLGDSNYTNFCNFSKNLNRRLLELGATPFYPVDYADDAIGLERVVEPWIDGLWNAVRKVLGLQPEGGAVQKDSTSAKPPPAKKAPTAKSKASTTIAAPEKGKTPRSSNSKDPQSVIAQLNPAARSKTSKQNGTTVGNKERSSSTSSSSPQQREKQKRGSAATLATNSSPLANRKDEKDERRVVAKAMTTQKEKEEEKDLTEVENVRRLMESLCCSDTGMSRQTLNLPPLPNEPLEIRFLPGNSSVKLSHFREASWYPSSATSVFMAKITSAKVLSRHDAVKKALEFELDLSESDHVQYEPGDAFSIICQNSDREVNWLIERLDLTDVAHKEAKINVKASAATRDLSHLPETWTPYGWLKYCCDIRGVPKKMFLRKLAESTSNAKEKRRILELCSRQGANDYSSLIRESSVNVLDILEAFPSCMPSLQTLLNGLLRLQPRSYSVSSSRLVNESSVRFVFNVVKLPQKMNFPSRRGVCTGWLNSITESFQIPFGESSDVKPDVDVKIPIFFRVNNRFKLPEAVKTPIIMVGPGTGVAPFIGFLEHRKQQRLAAKMTGMRLRFGEMLLFFGCRHKERDFLYRKDLEGFLSDRILSQLCVCFSRDEGQKEGAPKYVQHYMKQKGKEIADLIVNGDASIFVCGDARNMAKEVMATFSDILQEHSGKSADEASTLLKSMRDEKRYCEDVWT
ncbi:methionine synthase reductase-like [Oscarella lobularis]|uniref:methionine synthase reductase-like n=1 Tax=Oscarella lobularis TaxID=121494 RepID=UPI0033143E9C